MSPLASDYGSFLLRIWRLRRDGHSYWRLVLVSTANDQEWHFSSLDALAGFLDDKAWRTPDGSEGESAVGSYN